VVVVPKVFPVTDNLKPVTGILTIPCENGFRVLGLRCPPFHPCKKQLQKLHPNTIKPVTRDKPSLVRMGLGF
jgi:hypothetical protein